jgi:hypothetical protein
VTTQATSVPEVTAAPATWALVSDERGAGFVMATAMGGALHVHAGVSSPISSSGSGPAGGLVTAILDESGSVVVETSTAPPALLVSRDGVRLLSAEPAQQRATRMLPGDRLVLCCTGAHEQAPEGFLHLLRRVAPDMLRSKPEDLLADVLADVDQGAATLITRPPIDRHAPTTGEDRS